jgi:hypothetical protein
MKWKWFCHSLRVDRRKGRKYMHTWTVPCCYCYFTKYSAYPRGMRIGLLLFSFHFTNHVFGFPPLLSTFCIQVPKHVRQHSSTPLVRPFSIYFERHLLPNCISWIIIFIWNAFSRSKKTLSSNSYEHCLIEIFVQTLYFDFFKSLTS